MSKLTAAFLLPLLMLGCQKPKTEYFDLATISEIVQSPGYFSNAKVQVAGFAHYETGLLALSLFENKKQSEIFGELNHLIIKANDDYRNLLACKGKSVLISGVIKPHNDFGIFIEVAKDIKVIEQNGEVNEICYKLKSDKEANP